VFLDHENSGGLMNQEAIYSRYALFQDTDSNKEGIKSKILWQQWTEFLISPVNKHAKSYIDDDDCTYGLSQELNITKF